MNEKKDTTGAAKPTVTIMEGAKHDIETELKMLEAEIALLRAKRNALARALKGLGRFY